MNNSTDYQSKPDPKKQLAEIFGKTDSKKCKARGRAKYVPGEMNKTEARYAEELEERYKRGEIAWWAFEPIKLRLAKNTFYTPDFGVMLPSGEFEFIETKGFWEDDARAKIKCAADKYWMFDFLALKPKPKKDGGGWEREDFGYKC